MVDIFLSYRRNDGEAEAYLLYKDLISAGYSVFFDHKSLGSGDYEVAIKEEISNARSVLLVLSESSFSDRILDEKDVYRYEIKCALQSKKRLVGFMLESFPGFPEHLPDDIDEVRKQNSIKCYSGYYEEAFHRLTSGIFLPAPAAVDSKISPSNEAVCTTVPAELLQLAQLPIDQRIQQTQLLLQIMRTFNDSPICMRFYRYIDLYDRSRGVSDILDYDGDVPTDLVTYLSFFESLYIIIGSATLQLSVLDFAYRYRFFAGCNNPVMQNSELLPLGYQYPNILSLYNLWCDYIVDRYDHSVKCENINEEIPLYEYDLHKRYAAYCFAKKPGRPVRIRFLNKNLLWLNLTMKMLDADNLQQCMEFQKEMLETIVDNDSKNIFEPLTVEEMETSLKKHCCIGLFCENQLMAQINVMLEADSSENLMLDLDKTLQNGKPAIIDYIAVHKKARGYQIQKTLLFLAECIGRNNDRTDIYAVTSPYNSHSIKNFLSQSYKIVATQPKYKDIRHYLWKKIQQKYL